MPADGARDLPDISLFAAAGENDTVYPICTFPDECIVSGGNLTIGIVGGTSASSPAMAGIMALVNQKYRALGQANFTLYPLAAQHPSVFHDITTGSNVVPCQSGSPNCTLSAASDNTNGIFTRGGFYAGKGYDLATGLGSVDANLLVKYWNSLTFKSTSTTLSLSQTSFAHGTPVKVNVGVSGTGGTPSGDVALITTASPQTNTGFGDLNLQSGAASATVRSLPGGQYQVTARYGGDNAFASSSSTPVTVSVTPEASSLSLIGKYYDYSSRSFLPLASGGSYSYGTYIAFDAQASGTNGGPGVLDGIPTGTLSFADSSGSGSAALNLNRTGMAEWVPTAGSSAGSHSVNASYSGDPSFTSSTGTAPLNFTITKVAPGIDLYGAAYPIGVGQSTTFIVDVGLGALAAPPSGTVTFNSGNTVLGTAALGPVPYYNPSAAQATLTVSSLPLGTDTVTARYHGDSNYDVATSNAVSVTVIQPATVTASVNPPSGYLSQTYTVRTNVSGPANLPAPTGAVLFDISSGSSWVGTAQLVNGSASFTFDGTTFFPGTVSVAAEYLGDSSYAPFTVIVPVPMTIPFTMSATPVTISSPGTTTGNTSAITITPSTGFTGSIYFTCALSYYPPGAQHLPTGSVPASINVTGSNPVTANMTISSTPSTTTAASSLQGGQRWIAAQLGMTVAAFFLLGTSARRRSRRHLAGFLVVVALLGGLAGCGGGGNVGGGGGGKTIPGTTAGTYRFMLEGSFAPTFGESAPQIAQVTVTIQ